ncbi:MAG: hypothetical protein IH861_03010 [Chloroflexi bacterium]|nr:hypothetical protein [Chloroflexota bacterium]
MNFKVTAGLIIVALIVGVVALVNPFKEEEEIRSRSPWFYQVSEEDIETITVTHKGDSVTFNKVGDYTWAFQNPEGIPPDYVRWGGIPLLLSGPGTRRDLTVVQPIIEDPAQYGLDDPDTIVDVGLTAGRQIQFRLGDQTTDGRHVYGQVLGFPDLFIIAGIWGEVISRLAFEPPLPKWAVERTPDTIAELNVYLGDAAEADTPFLNFSRDFRSGEWSVRKFDVDKEKRPVDEERWKDIEPLVVGPGNISVAVPIVDDRDYSPWGIVDSSNSIEIRFSGTSDSGTRFTDGFLLRLGDKTEDGKYYYAKSVSDFVRQPVLKLDAQWVETILGLFDDVPYGDKEDA